MHPVIYCEVKQSMREYKTILFLLAVLILSRTFLGDYGHLINLFIFFPIIAGALGTGLLYQEYSKDYMKYLYSLPIKRWHLILIKMINSILATGLFLLIIYIIKWLIPPKFVLPEAFFSAFFKLTPLIAFSMIIAVFNFGVCTFCITFLRSSKIAGNVNYILLVAALLYLGYCFLETGYKYQTADYVLLFMPVSLLLTFGGFYLFTLRNPFLNRNPRHQITGFLIAVVSAAYFVGITKAVTYGIIQNPFIHNQAKPNFVFDKGIIEYSVSPDGEFVSLRTSPDGFFDHSGVFDADGRLVVDLGRHSSINDLTWQFNNEKRILFYMIEKPFFSDFIFVRDRFVKYYAIDLDTLKKYPFKPINRRNLAEYYNYKFLDNRTMDLLALGDIILRYQHEGLCILKQNLLTGSITMTRIPDSKGWSAKQMDAKHITISTINPIGFVIYDIEKQKAEQILLPEGLDYRNYEIHGNKCYYCQRTSDDYGYSFRIAVRTIDNHEETLLTPQHLPRISYRQAAEGFGSGISLEIPYESQWLQCRYNDPNGNPHLMLIDREGNRMTADPKIRRIVSAPGQRRFFAVKYDMGIEDPNTRIIIDGPEIDFIDYRPYYKDRDSAGPIDQEKNRIYIYDILDWKTVLVKSIDLDKDCYQIEFLNDSTLLYLKDPTPENEGPEDDILMKMNLETMESAPFINLLHSTAKSLKSQ